MGQDLSFKNQIRLVLKSPDTISTALSYYILKEPGYKPITTPTKAKNPLL